MINQGINHPFMMKMRWMITVVAAVHLSSVSSDAASRTGLFGSCKDALLSRVADPEARVVFLALAAACSLPFIPAVVINSCNHRPEWVGTQEPGLLEGRWKEPVSKLVEKILTVSGQSELQISEIEPPIRLGAGYDSYAVYFKVVGPAGDSIKGRLGFRLVVDSGGERRIEIASSHVVPFYFSGPFSPESVVIDRSVRTGDWILYRGSKDNLVVRFAKIPSVVLDR
jgi:hypothetical protein